MNLEQLKKANDLNQEIRDVKYDIQELKKVLQKKILDTDFVIKNYRVKVNCNNSNFNINEDRFYSFLSDELNILEKWLEDLETEFKNI